MVRGNGPSLGVFQNWRVWAELVFVPEAVSAGGPSPTSGSDGRAGAAWQREGQMGSQGVQALVVACNSVEG